MEELKLQQEAKISQQDYSFIAQNNTSFSNSLYTGLLHNSEVLYSPINIMTALQMLYQGSKGKTQQVMKKLLNITTDNNTLLQAFENFISTYNQNNKDITIQMANKIVCENNKKINKQYQQNLQKYFNSDIEQINLEEGKQQGITSINNWVSQKTKGKISKIVNQLPKDISLLILSAIYFKGVWKNKFKKKDTKKDVFYGQNNQQLPVDMMSQENKFRYLKGKNFQALQLPYKDSNYSMVVILPEKQLNNEFAEFQKNFMDKNTFQKVFDDFQSTRRSNVQVYLPKFELSNKISLKYTLEKMGMEDAFSEKSADFSKIYQNKEPLYVSDVVHKVYIKVDEEGSEAAAVTIVKVKLCKKEKKKQQIIFRADRNFLYCIMDNQYGNILFVGNFQGNNY